jgi:outer membrane protein assembly factor BamB
MRKGIWTKILVLGLIWLYIVTSVVPNINGQSKNKIISEQCKKPTTDWWPMFLHDKNHSGFTTSYGPDTNNILWNSTVNDSIYFSSPAISNGRVFIGSNDNDVYCFDEYTGNKIWSFSTGDDVLSSPAVVNGRVYIGSLDYKMYCLNASTGAKIWEYLTEGWIESPPVVVDGRIYFGSWDEMLYCLNATDGTFNWCTSPSPGRMILCSPIVNEGRVYAINGYQTAFCLDYETGSIIWEYIYGGSGSYAETSPAFANNKIYFISFEGVVFCLNAINGSLIWNFNTQSSADSSPIVLNEKVYIGTVGGLFCLNADNGSLIWSKGPMEGFASSPAVADNRLYIGTNNGVRCFDAESGTNIWDYQIGACVRSSPAIVNGKMFIGCYNHKLYCFGQPNLPPYVKNLSGNSSGRTGIEYTFKINLYDQDNDNISCTWDWGDGNISGWQGPYNNGTTTYTSHTWSAEGTYNIKVKPKDQHGLEGNWSAPFVITINQSLTKTFIFGKYNNLTTDGKYIIVNVLNLRIITFKPFQFLHYIAGEKVKFSKNNIKAMILPRFIFGMVDVWF